MNRTGKFVILGVLVVLGLAFIFMRQYDRGIDEDRVQIVASLYPMAEFARNVGGDFVTVSTVVPNGVEPHDFEPAARDVAGVYDADIFVYVGSLEPWADRLWQGRPTAASPVALRMMDMVKDELRTAPEEEHEDGEEEEDDHDSQDPHIWLDPVLVRQQVEAIRDALIAVDPLHTADYRTQADIYLQTVNDLHQTYMSGLKNCEQRSIVVSHDAFGYLGARYGITIIGISGLSPEAEPSPKHLAELTEKIRTTGIRYVFFETLVSPKIAETLAKEAGVQTLPLNPIESITEKEENEGKNYITLMQENLQNLRTAMVCQ